ncbi:MAG: hypothetical protein M5U12_31605 [Verrucomicrobia bacterium]|nr:hypothetical protein [Verrucomicrobiota bacterium]
MRASSLLVVRASSLLVVRASSLLVVRASSLHPLGTWSRDLIAKTHGLPPTRSTPDPVFLTLTGADVPLPAERDVARTFGPSAATGLLRQLNAVLFESETPTAEHLTLELLPDLVPEKTLVLVREIPHNAWLWLGPTSSNPAADIPALEPLFRGGPRPPPAPADVRTEFAQFGPLDTHPDARDTLFFQLALRLLARAVLRDVARRLPGFANSRPAFLRENVLHGPLRLECSSDGWQAQLGPVPCKSCSP